METQYPGRNMVHVEDSLKAIAVAVASGRNIVEYGHGGYAKSMLTEQVFDWFERDGAETGMMVCSVNTNVPDLFGGLHPDFVKDYVFDRPRFEDSMWATKDLVALEEGFDAPPRSLAALKHMLVARQWRYANTVIPMRTRSVFVLTNHEPKEIAKLDPSVAAFVERFPVSVRVHWPNHSAKSFKEMYAKLSGAMNGNGHDEDFVMPTWEEIRSLPEVACSDEMDNMLATFMHLAYDEGSTVSPRTAVYAREVVMAWAAISGATEVEPDHMDALRFIYGIEVVYDTVTKRMEHEIRVMQDHKFLAEFKKAAAELSKAPTKKGVLKAELVSTAKSLKEIYVAMSSHKWSDPVSDEAKDIMATTQAAEKQILSELGIG